jgi:hypothetical protein
VKVEKPGFQGRNRVVGAGVKVENPGFQGRNRVVGEAENNLPKAPKTGNLRKGRERERKTVT